MSQICELIARELVISETECEPALYASSMHDVGKIAIPDAILLKKGPLNDEEWEIMKTHSAAGDEIMGNNPEPLLHNAAQAAQNHHEKWDGSGYPNGISGKNIPLVARMAAVADVFDALTSKRPYKKACPLDKAMDLIKEQAGTLTRR